MTVSFGTIMNTACSLALAFFIASAFIYSVEKKYEMGKWESFGLFIMALLLVFLLFFYVLPY